MDECGMKRTNVVKDGNNERACMYSNISYYVNSLNHFQHILICPFRNRYMNKLSIILNIA